MTRDTPLQRLARAVEQAASICAVTGAGISTASGIPDFRSQGGIWEGVDPLEECSLGAFHRDPIRFWNFYRERLQFTGEYRPNPAHLALGKLWDHGLRHIVTQNIDGLHAVAGPQEIIEIHGNARTMSCLDCRRSYSFDAALSQRADRDGVPRCECGAALKPDVVLFGEDLPQTAHQAMAWCHDADLVLAIGSSLIVEPVASWTTLNRARGGRLAILTASSTPKDNLASVIINDPVQDVLPALIDLLGERQRAR